MGSTYTHVGTLWAPELYVCLLHATSLCKGTPTLSLVFSDELFDFLVPFMVLSSSVHSCALVRRAVLLCMPHRSVLLHIIIFFLPFSGPRLGRGGRWLPNTSPVTRWREDLVACRYQGHAILVPLVRSCPLFICLFCGPQAAAQASQG